MRLWPTGLDWKSKAARRVPPVSKKFKGTVTHGNGGVFFTHNAKKLSVPNQLKKSYRRFTTQVSAWLVRPSDFISSVSVLLVNSNHGA